MTVIEQVRKSYTPGGTLAPSALSLAYIGDTVYDLFVRTYLLDRHDVGMNELHALSAGLVCAKGQAEAFFRIEPLLTDDERAVYRRGRNAHSGSVPKNAKLSDYRVATGLEALLGQLYLSGADERLCVIMSGILNAFETGVQRD